MTQHITASPRVPSSRAAQRSPLLPPAPVPRPLDRTLFGDTVHVPYRWLRDYRSSEVTAHFAAENAYTDARTAHLAPLISDLQAAADAPVSPVGLTAPVLLDGWWYIDRCDPVGGSTLSRVRDHEHLHGPAGVPVIEQGHLLEGEQILVEDCRTMIGFAVSPDSRLLARAEAALGGCRLIVTEAATGEVLDSAVEGAGPDLVFSADSQHLLHTRLDDLGRRHEVRSHRLGTTAREDALLLEEPDHWAQLELTRSRDGSALLIRSDSPRGGEVWLTDLAATAGPPRSLTGRVTGTTPPLLEHAGDRLLVIHEDRGTRRSVLSETSLETTGALTDLQTLLTAREGEHFESVEAFAGVIALQLRDQGVPAVRLIPRREDGSLDAGAVQVAGPGGELDAVRLEPAPAWGSRRIRCRLDGFLTPGTLVEHDLETGESIELLREEHPGFDPERYVAHRLWATSPDGTLVPISLLAPRDLPRDGSAPAVLFGNGAFGTTTDPRLRPEFRTFADRGVVVAIAHVRGGGEMGPQWHRQGRGAHKQNSFADLVACADLLVETGWVSPDRIGLIGHGAGGLLAAGASNLAPDRFRALLTVMPLADPLEALLDPDVMLTLEEWAEWGDPAEDEATYRDLRGYTPTENIRAEQYPAVYAWTAHEGTEVPPGCAATWIATLRDTVTSSPEERPILLRTMPTPGTGGDPRREGVAWLLDQLGATTLGA
ncbi:protease [Brachybacterium ginsengisoli]|uniref:Protease n=1 Tax=Brachybacterium ginsengisoli TaxID=1331682 RepID=A0A291H0P9_9MICO|nr:prolyl oligopeptidase family serine peptidase [Brachybacterium ginsengisoli]ATG56031.1 protease [Brachybacterium ginsengisoli]